MFIILFDRGKFAQGHYSTTKLVADVAELYKYMTDPTLKILNWHIVTEDIVYLEYEQLSEFEVGNSVTNLYIASFTTAYARLKLYEVLELLQGNLYYCDTDSCVFKHSAGDPMPELSNLLGGLVSELPTGVHITDFVATAPKSYSMKLSNGECVTKIKGFQLNHFNSQVLNFEALKNMVFNQDLEIKTLNTCQIKRDKKNFQIRSVDEVKKHSFTFTQRQIKEDFTTLPFGY